MEVWEAANSNKRNLFKYNFSQKRCSWNAIIEIVKHELNNDEAISLFVKEYTRYITQLESATNKVAEQALKEKLKLEKQKKNIIESIKNGVPADLLDDDSLEKRMAELHRATQRCVEIMPCHEQYLKDICTKR